MAPTREPIPIQRWSVRRIGLAVAVLVGVVAMLAAVSFAFFSYDPQAVADPECPTSTPVLLYGQAVATARYVPCVASLPVEWDLRDVTVQNGHGNFTLDAAALGTVAVHLRSTCNTSGDEIDSPVPNDGVDAVLRQTNAHQATMVLSYAGGCVVLDFKTSEVTVNALLDAVTAQSNGIPRVLRLIDREKLNDAAQHRTDGRAEVLTRA